MVSDLSEELVQDLGVRDELEFEKVERAAPIGWREFPCSMRTNGKGPQRGIERVWFERAAPIGRREIPLSFKNQW